MIQKNKNIFRLFLLVILILFFSSCLFFENNIKTEIYHNINDIILKQANDLVGRAIYSKVIVNGKTFTLDCIGTVSAIFYSAGIDITKYFNKYSGNGVSRFYATLKNFDSLHDEKMPEKGDVIFWDNTWDRNNDGIIGNDPLTHAGVVMQVDEDGTIHYIHANYVFGIIVEQMNLLNPTVYKDGDGKILNTPMFINSSLKKHPEHWLSGDLFKQFGRVLKVKELF